METEKFLQLFKDNGQVDIWEFRFILNDGRVDVYNKKTKKYEYKQLSNINEAHHLYRQIISRFNNSWQRNYEKQNRIIFGSLLNNESK